MKLFLTFSNALRAVATFAAMLALVNAARAAYEGPVPAPTDVYGGPGAYPVITETFPSPDWPGQVVTVMRPDGAPGKRPVWFFAHGFGAVDPAHYDELLRHLASHGSYVIYSPYPVNPLDAGGNYTILYDGFIAAANRYADRIDTTRVGFMGHSYGGGAVPALALRAVRERGWGGQGLALMLLAPWYSFFVSDSDLASFPAGTQVVVEVFEDDAMNDHRMAIDIFMHLNVQASDKDYLMLHSDRIDGYNYAANHRVPAGALNPADGTHLDALDAWGIHRIAQALTASAFDRDAAGRAIALGHGSATQTQMGTTTSGRALRPMSETSAPVPLFPSSRYQQYFDRPLNPRRNATLPATTKPPHLSNLSVRGWSGSGTDVMIAGATIGGTRPKSLLVRAVGPGLAKVGVNSAMPDPQLLTYRGTAPDIFIDDWAQTPEPAMLAQVTTETGAFALADGSKDAALLASFAPGALTVHAPPASGSPGTVLLELYEAEDDASATLDNLSARARVGSGEARLIAGFVTSGGDMRVLVRGVGPALSAYGVQGAIADPVLEIYRGSSLIASNDNWSSSESPATEITAAALKVGAFPLPLGSADSCLLLTLAPGAYTAQVRSADGTVGVGLVEVYTTP